MLDVVFFVALASFIIAFFLVILKGVYTGRLKVYDETFVRKKGKNAFVGEYDIYSFDGEVTWYTVKPANQTGPGIKVIGPASDKLLAKLKVWEDFQRHVRSRNGKFALGDFTTKDLYHLQQMGFSCPSYLKLQTEPAKGEGDHN